jgi:hydroxymethylbilane synthase
MASPGVRVLLVSESPGIEERTVVRIGTRGSALALAQADMVASRLREAHPSLRFELTIVKTEGDTDKTSPLTVIGGRGVFTSALQGSLLNGDIDLAVHSAKDVPSLSPAGLVLAAFPDREDARDALVSRHGVGMNDLPANPVIGTSSRRRAVQIAALRPDAVIRDLRGNIDTRLRKAQGDEYDAIVLAVAGITRMGWSEAITQPLAVEFFTPAPAQGAIAVETRDEPDLRAIVEAIGDSAVAGAVAMERAFLRGVGGGCTTPIGAHAVPVDGGYRLDAMLASDDGSRVARERTVVASEDEAFALARRMQRAVGVATAARPLVLTTGSAKQQANLAQVLDAIGVEVLHLESIRIEATGIQAKVSQAAWVVITSANAFPFANGIVQAQLRGGARLAVVGDATRRAAESEGFHVDLTGPRDGAALAAALADVAVPGDRVLCLGSDIARPETSATLKAAGFDVSTVAVYTNVASDSVPEDVLRAVERGAVSVVTFASPSAVLAFVSLLGSSVAALSGASFVAIGETTATAMRDAGLPVHEIAAEPGATAMAEAVQRALHTV